MNMILKYDTRIGDNLIIAILANKLISIKGDHEAKKKLGRPVKY